MQTLQLLRTFVEWRKWILPTWTSHWLYKLSVCYVCDPKIKNAFWKLLADPVVKINGECFCKQGRQKKKRLSHFEHGHNTVLCIQSNFHCLYRWEGNSSSTSKRLVGDVGMELFHKQFTFLWVTTGSWTWSGWRSKNGFEPQWNNIKSYQCWVPVPIVSKFISTYWHVPSFWSLKLLLTVLQIIKGNISTWIDCHNQYHRSQPAPNGQCIKHQEWWECTPQDLKLLHWSFEYHCKPECVWLRCSGFNPANPEHNQDTGATISTS